ncbi:MAG: translesion DNA synthesis-associated protein ImuA [Hylemonella sp.]|nr:translesion DNA synthesis-associated protein ImuA [Hylemonella sp.]
MSPLSSLALPGVWRGDAWAGSPGAVVASGHGALDAELPGGGWPTGELIDLLQPPAGWHEWRLLLPALRLVQRHGPLVLVGSPHPPHLAALAAQGVAPEGLWWVDTAGHNERLWAAEQVLRSGTAGAVLVWLPQARPEQLRRLHLAARAAVPSATEHAGPLLFALRAEATRQQASPAPLRLLLRSAAGGLQVQVFKRRGPPMDRPITLAAELPVLACLRHWPAPAAIPLVRPEPAHVVDRSVAVAA